MSTGTTPSSQQKHDLTDQVESFEFTTGVSKKTGNPYVVGSVRIKTPIGSYRFGLEYLDENAQNAANAAIAQKANKTRADFSEGLKD